MMTYYLEERLRS